MGHLLLEVPCVVHTGLYQSPLFIAGAPEKFMIISALGRNLVAELFSQEK